MKITDVEAIVLQVGEIDTSRADGTQDAFIVRVHTDEGLVGVGEGDTSPYVAARDSEHALVALLRAGLREVLIGQDPVAGAATVGRDVCEQLPLRT